MVNVKLIGGINIIIVIIYILLIYFCDFKDKIEYVFLLTIITILLLYYFKKKKKKTILIEGIDNDNDNDNDDVINKIITAILGHEDLNGLAPEDKERIADGIYTIIYPAMGRPNITSRNNLRKALEEVIRDLDNDNTIDYDVNTIITSAEATFVNNRLTNADPPATPADENMWEYLIRIGFNSITNPRRGGHPAPVDPLSDRLFKELGIEKSNDRNPPTYRITLNEMKKIWTDIMGVSSNYLTLQKFKLFLTKLSLDYGSAEDEDGNRIIYKTDGNENKWNEDSEFFRIFNESDEIEWDHVKSLFWGYESDEILERIKNLEKLVNLQQWSSAQSYEISDLRRKIQGLSEDGKIDEIDDIITTTGVPDTGGGVAPEVYIPKPLSHIEKAHPMGLYDGLCLNNITKDNNNVKLVKDEELETYFGLTVPLKMDRTLDDRLEGPSIDGKVGSPQKLSMLGNNRTSISCCDYSPYSTSTGCICLTDDQENYISSRGNNHNTPDSNKQCNASGQTECYGEC